MNKSRSKLGTHLFKLAAAVYDNSSPLRVELGDMLFKLAASVSPDKLKPATKKLVGKAKKTVKKKTVKKSVSKK